MLGPQQQHGRHGAPVLQHNSQFKQQIPALPEHPTHVQSLRQPQLTQHRAQHKTTLSSLTASPQQQHMMKVDYNMKERGEEHYMTRRDG